jgi:hypothetical protein
MSGRTTTLQLWCGAIGPPLFFLVFLVEGATRRGYDPVRLPISLLALGDLGWMQVANFVLIGVLMLVFAVGLRRTLPSSGWPSRWGPILIGLFGVGLIGGGVFAADPGGGFPPGFRPPAGSTGTLHDLSTLVVFGSLIGAAAVFSWHFRGRRRRAWSAYSALTSIALAIGFVMMFAGLSGSNDITPVAGIVQRVTIAVGWTWLALLAVLQIRSSRMPTKSS